ncbi:Lrp/AsnC family transcriptional regulator [Pseudohalocynthiibacter aestuariivivens]|jgi:Lrp/AsnC family transcriptional regulator, leucine-responsive regulatory protein|uniref:Lrp/AsnC family transcriptional regulator n=1 Tax=Pseudohalocynthiibacter aestuariivivens TaxID=1591409 RepID=A0ABV5JC00_9RHOB|nr:MULTISPECIES: Lrp/AsnC family transcriptional regulator [Pseudohalocynthiibacter]MBS9718363.1 Lrp/AsnC family transcriptional regulator [Pseudohalocynthiibacter aestuariivivens]MCK0103372.1 Lrp/AsnC family transcriptional regulator [Pseudohalocynthiibacter sp. F2068]
MDELDLKILALVQDDARQTAERISDLIGLSPTAIQKRLKKLRDSKIIQKEIAVLDPGKLGQTMTAVVEVSLERENLSVLDAFKKRMRNAPQVQQCYYTTGEADFILVVVVKDIKAYETFTHEYFFGTPEISKFKTSIVMDRVKVSLNVDIQK